MSDKSSQPVLLIRKIVKFFTMFSDRRERVETSRAETRIGWQPCRPVNEGTSEAVGPDSSCGSDDRCCNASEHDSGDRIASGDAKASSFWQSRRASFLAVILIIAAVAITYSNSFSGVFVFDDFDAITRNPTVQRLWPIWQTLSPPSKDSAVLSRPIVNLSLAINYAISGEAVWSYHVLNLIAHILAAMVLFSILRRTLSLPGLCERFNAVAIPLAFVITLLWAVHPLLTNAVTYIVQRTEVLSGLFYLLTLYCAIRSSGATFAKRWWCFSLVAYLLAMGCKESAVSAPVIVLFYDRVFLSPSWREVWKRRRGLYLGFCVTWLILLVGHSMAASGKTILGNQWWHDTAEYALAQCGSIILYLRLTFFPYPLILDYGYLMWQPPYPVLPYFLLLCAMVVGLILAWRRWPWISFLGLWFFAILAPSSSILPILSEVAAEKRTYLPLAAVLTFVVVVGYVVGCWVMQRCRVSDRRASILAWSLVSCLTLMLVAVAYHRNIEYQNELGLWQDTLAKRPTNRRARTNLARCYCNLSGQLGEQGQLDEAVRCCKKAISIEPSMSEPHLNLGKIWIQRDQFEKAIAEYQRALQLKPNSAPAYLNLGIVHARQGHPDQAMECYRKALDIQPDYREAYECLGALLVQQGRFSEAIDCYRTAIQSGSPSVNAYLKLGDVFLRLGRLNDAMTCCQNALLVYPKSAAVYNQIGWICACRGQVREAVNFFHQALSFDPNNVDARVNLAMALVTLGQTADAATHFAEVLKTHPNHLRACSGLAWLRATAPDHSMRKGTEAVKLAERAVELTHRQDPDTLDVLAAAYAEAGQYDKAAEIAQQAITLATSQSKANLVFAYRNRLKLYEMDQPYREKLIPSATLPQDDFLSKDQLK